MIQRRYRDAAVFDVGGDFVGGTRDASMCQVVCRGRG